MTDADVVTFADLTGDRAPVHLDEAFAASSPFRRRIAHGMLGLSLASGLAVAAPPARTVAFLGLREWAFLAPIYLGDVIRVRSCVVEKRPRGPGYYGLGLSMSLPCYDLNQGPRLRARSRAAQEGHELQAKLVELRAEVERLTREYRLARANAAAVGQTQLRLARDIRDAVLTAYRVGGRTLLEVFEAQRNYRETARAYVTNRANLFRAASRIQNATGVKVER